MNNSIRCMVGDEQRVIDFDLFVEVHTHLADFYRALGLTGDRLDIAIVEELPHRLAAELGSTNIVPLR